MIKGGSHAFIGDKEYWEEKFACRGDKPLSPEKSLVENIKYFKDGSVLDVACGDGRNGLFLMENGFKVTGVDFSSKALERFKIFAERKKYVLNTKQIDLSQGSSLKDIGIFDNILINHYKLSSEQLADTENHITDEGILFICGFGHKHKVDHKIKKEDLIQEADFINIKKLFHLIKYIENEETGDFLLPIFFAGKYK
ncbi:2-polyprenyl-3-methyl-5-hydroxy-6-metoxy-1,4-benzoquinol methylase [Clostridium pascui]|uniref:class I SAM-dependent methyltransferase n=1 Tax=Clostridium pascui TaxID=46609 RepID=UPI001FB01D03|nr:methyltransferase domain-containing protein [Clostridium pascui]MBM7871571.1 2-polyprenyl-3-methyl-5-hydroxy-6-metoxy-1,4-benzoquinol methylase [Clostridium pascui]